MGHFLEIVLPVFGLIGVGAAVTQTNLLKNSTGDALADFVFLVAIPLLVFRIVATADLAGISAWRLWLSFFVAFAVCWVAGTILTRRIFGRDARAGLVAGLCAGYGNTTLIGLPLAITAFGRDGSVPMAIIIAVQLPLMMTAVALLMVRAERQDGVGSGHVDAAAVVISVAKDLARNPIVVCLAAGAVWRFSGIPLVGLPADLVNRVADVASPLALVATGMSLRKYGIHGNIGAGFALTLLKLLAMPALALVFARLIGLPPTVTKVAVIAAACPTGVTPFLVAGRFRTGEGLASTTITMSTVLAVLSVALWLKVVDWL